MTAEERTAARQTKAAAVVARAAMWRELDGGYALGPDEPPGVGWVLRLPKGPGREISSSKGDHRARKYYPTERQALAAYENHRRYGWTGWGPPPRGMDPDDAQRAREVVRISREVRS